MSKRLNKRQQRELEELEQLKAIQQAQIATDSEEEQEDDEGDGKGVEADQAGGGGVKVPANAFDALDDQDEAGDDSADDTLAAAPKKSKKKKPKKKKKATTAVLAPEEAEEHIDDDEGRLDASLRGTEADQTTTSAATAAAAGTGSSTPQRSSKKSSKASKGKQNKKDKKEDDGLDEIDRALAELGMENGESSSAAAAGDEAEGATKSGMAGGAILGFRQMLSVDTKNLDADAELKRFFGSRVITSTPSGSTNRSHRPTPSSKLRYTISKPKPTYPPSTSLAGLGMREMTADEVEEVHDVAQSGRLAEWRDAGEKWFTFEHAGQWREIVRQFLGAVQSHDPNTLMALLQVYPWHVDTLMQMSEVYRLQSDIGAASDYAERALYALDRCLAPSFNVSSGTCRLDFNRVENRPMFMALHRIISYLGRRGCWVTAFNFAKLLFSLDPMNDPHGAAFWLDFLAIKSGNYQWILDVFEKHAEQFPVAVFQGYPGMAYAYALACRTREDAEKEKDRTRSDDALREAMLAFPQVILPMADKLGISVPDKARTEPLLQVQVGHSTDPLTPVHLLSHIYISRSEALWKEAPLASWFERTIPTILPDLMREDAVLSRADVLRLIQTPRDPMDEHLNVPLFICRHVLCSESTSFLGFLPSSITSRSFSAHDPVPPSTATSLYNGEYFAGVRRNKRSQLAARAMGLDDRAVAGGGGGGGGAGGMMRDLMHHIYAIVDAHPTDWRTVLRDTMNRAMGMAQQMGEDVPQPDAQGRGGAADAVEQTVRMAEEMVAARERGEDGLAGQEEEGEGDGGEDGDGDEGMPGAFPR